MRDVELKTDPSELKLLLQKHTDYIAAYDSDKNDYVCEMPSPRPPVVVIP